MFKRAFLAFILILSLTGGVSSSRSAMEQTSYRFDFSTGASKPGWQPVIAPNVYTAEKGYGFEGAPDLPHSAGSPVTSRSHSRSSCRKAIAA